MRTDIDPKGIPTEMPPSVIKIVSVEGYDRPRCRACGACGGYGRIKVVVSRRGEAGADPFEIDREEERRADYDRMVLHFVLASRLWQFAD